jgi:two-component system CheB/CheR fusion protein
MNEAALPGGIIPDTGADGTPGQEPHVQPAIPVVGIGASAGGLDVFKRLLSRLPPDSGFAIVFVQHLDPKHHSLLAEILSRATAMPVSEAADGMRVEANHVYVIPASVDLTMAGGALMLTPRTEAAGSHMPIDRFLRSVADQCGSRGIGVILSGTGSDGSAGIAAIRGAGGVTFAQDLTTARFPAMPQAAAATGCVDFVLPPEGIAEELVRIGHHPYVAADSISEGGMPSADEEHFGGILAVLRAANGIDFSVYREKMVKRRILRRLALRNVDGVTQYRKLLERDSSELAALQQDLLIGVTSFFRDPEAFERLKGLVFPRILQGRRPAETVRIWVAGCATGEEAFSIAIAITEYLQDAGAAFPVRVFASDISMPAIDKARRGRYAENITADVSPERLARHFTKIEGGYQINKNLREMVVFSRHNLIGDPPFSKVDLITCRNVLIYLGRVQRDIIRLFHYALRSNGFLLLGASEAAAADLFSAADPEQRIFSKREVRNRHVFPGAPTVQAGRGRLASIPSNAPPAWDGVDVSKAVDRILISKYSPAGVVVDDDLEVVEIRGKANPYLTLPAGKMSFNLVKLIHDTGLFLEVEKLIEQARKSGGPTRQEHVRFATDESADGLSVEVVPLDGVPTRCLVLFEPKAATTQPAETPDPAPEEDPRDREISRLKRQLTAAKERFLSAIEAHQSSREESQNTTEEALSANEELQSLNEELETAKEELQSSNEELVTVNDELQHKNADLAQARDFAFSIVETIRQPLVVLDTDLRIRMANRAFYRTFQISPQDAEGHAITSLSHGSWDLPGLQDALAGLVHDGNSFPDFEVEQEFTPFGRRTLVLGGCRINHLKMILLAIDDITERRLAQHVLKRTEDHLRQSQKMEAVGRLAGGIAHDFNNLLTAVIGYSSLLEDRLAADPSALQDVLQIKIASDRAISLTQQLLSFSRRQI